jgi:hypothetical protein
VTGQEAARSAGRAMRKRNALSAGSHPGSPRVPDPRRPANEKPRFVTDAAGFDLRPDPLRADTPAALADALREYWIWAGRPSFRKLARLTGGHPAASTMCIMLSGGKLPAFDCMRAFLIACGASEEDCRRFTTTWRRLSLSRGEAREMQQVPVPRGSAEWLPDHQD